MRRLFKFAPCLLILLATMLPTGALSQQQQPLTDAQKSQVYDEAVHILGGNANVISRWVGDIRYRVIGSEKLRQQAYRVLQDVSAITRLPLDDGNFAATSLEIYLESFRIPAAESNNSCRFSALNFSTTNKGENLCANFIIIQTGKETMRSIAEIIPLRKVYRRALASAESVSCFFVPLVSSNQVIHQALVYINENLDEALLQTCLQEEIFQSFGLFNDYSGSDNFSFNNRVEPKPITHFDRALLKTVYDAEFAPGTPVFKVMSRFMETLD